MPIINLFGRRIRICDQDMIDEIVFRWREARKERDELKAEVERLRQELRVPRT